ncbi:MAG: 30S ribosomal protein THX [Cyclobacteriaceae bacterium]
MLLELTNFMGRGDKKSRKGKIWKGSYGNTRRRKSKTTGAVPVSKAEGAETKPKAKKAPKKRAKAE